MKSNVKKVAMKHKVPSSREMTKAEKARAIVKVAKKAIVDVKTEDRKEHLAEVVRKSPPPPSVIKRTTKKALAIPVMDFSQAYEQSLENRDVALTAICPVNEELAYWILSMNPINRSLSKAKCESYTEDMRSGDWWEGHNGEPIRFSKSGILLDGQNRIVALATSNVTVSFQFIFNVEDDAFASLDTGGVRRPHHVLNIVGYRNTTKLASSLNLLYRWINKSMHGRALLSNQGALELIDRNPKLVKSCEFTDGCPTTVMSTSLAGFLHYIFAKVCRRDADDFMDRLMHGHGLTRNGPLHILRVRLEKASTEGKAYALTREERLIFVMKTWNHIRSGETKKLSLKRTDTMPFPKTLL